MSEHYDFHYQPTGSGAISGQQVLQQTEDAINELGDYVNDNVGGAMDVAQQALETAQNAEQDAQTALDTANSFSSAIQSAQQDASSALSTAQTAQTTASNANNTAIQAQQDASSAVTTANNASGQVNTLSGTVTALGQRVTTAEGNIGQNTSDITALTTRVGTAEGNITTLQNDVSIAQGNASSAMATAGQVKQQAYVFRYSSTALTASSTNSNTLLDNTDNLKVGDKVIDSSGVLFSITAIDTQNSTFTIGTALIDLAQDSDVVHKSGDETIAGVKTFSDLQIIGYGTQYKGSRNAYILPEFAAGYSGLSITTMGFSQTLKIGNFVLDANNKPTLDASKGYIQIATGENNSVNACVLEPRNSTSSSLGASSNRWSKIYGTEYYYGSNNVEFSTKFVTTDTNQTISGSKTFKQNITYERTNFYHQVVNPTYILKDTELEKGSLATTHASYPGLWQDKNGNILGYIRFVEYGSGRQTAEFRVSNLIKNGALDPTGSEVNCIVDLELQPSGEKSLIPEINNDVNLGTSTNKWKSFNGLEPSSLGMPDLSNGIDISSYITDLTGASNINIYTPSVNGWISIGLIDADFIEIYIPSNLMGGTFTKSTIGRKYSQAFMPVIANKEVKIALKGSSISWARFYPCLGNV